jgi:hypothetical protein
MSDVDVRTSESYRLIQVFLSAEGRGIFETYVSTDDNAMVCTCPGFYYRQHCKHTEYIEDTIKSTPGNTYNVQVVTPNGGDFPDVDTAAEFRAWMLDHCRVVVL